MKTFNKLLITSAVASLVSISALVPAYADMDLDSEAAVAGMAVALNNYYASTLSPEEGLASAVAAISAETYETEAPTEETVETIAAESEPAAESQSSAYDNIAVSRVTDYVNIRSDASTSGTVVGKIYNNCAATILNTIDGEGGQWYQIKSGSVTGYIKSEYFVTGSEAENLAKDVGTKYATVSGTSTLRLRETPDINGKTLTLLAEGAQYVVLSQEGDFIKVAVDSDLEGYIFKDYASTSVQFENAVSVDEEAAKQAEADRLKAEADEALKKLEDAKKEEAKREETKKETTAAATTKAETEAPVDTKAPETTTEEETAAPSAEVGGTIAANPDQAVDGTVSAPTTVAETTTAAPETTAKATTAAPENNEGPGGSSPSGSGEVTSATRNAIVAYSKQFLGNPYVFGGTSLTNGADCSGFTQAIYSHFGIAIGRSSRDQAANGSVISQNDAQPGDLFFYASGDYINHVAMYIGGGQVIHASSSTTGIILSPANYRTPCKVVTFLN